MYLSQLILNPRRREVRRDLASPYELHRTLLRAFPSQEAGGAGRVLFRVEPSGNNSPPVVLVQSAKRPDWLQLPTDYAHVQPVKDVLYAAADAIAATVTNSRASVLVELRRGDVLRFRMNANPTVKRDGKRHALWQEADQIAWLIRKGAASGFTVSESSVTVAPVGRLDSRRSERSNGRVATVSHHAVRFEGMLQVVDPALLVVALENGVGSAKGFGFGLLSVGRI
jgi:CRISPR system Cascade subunit CasE